MKYDPLTQKFIDFKDLMIHCCKEDVPMNKEILIRKAEENNIKASVYPEGKYGFYKHKWSFTATQLDCVFFILFRLKNERGTYTENSFAALCDYNSNTNEVSIFGVSQHNVSGILSVFNKKIFKRAYDK